MSIQRSILVCGFLAVVAAALGCGRPAVKPKVATSNATPQVEETSAAQDTAAADAPDEENDSAPASADEADANASSDATSTAGSDPSGGDDSRQDEDAGHETEDETQVDGESDAAPVPHRFALFTPGGPLIVTVIVTIDGKPHSAVVDDLIEEVLSQADSDGDGRPTWDEVIQNPTFIYGLLGNQPLRGGQARVSAKRQYDIDQDGLVDRREVPRFITAGRGNERSIALLPSGYQRDRRRLDSPLRRLLDDDRNGSISPDEIALARERLIGRDADDDRILYAAEISLTETPDPNMMQQTQRRRGSGPEAAMWLSKLTSWGSLMYTLEELYTFDGVLTPESFPLLPELFDDLDENEDRIIVRQELPALIEMAPHVVLEASFGKNTQSDASPALRLVALGEAIEHAATDLRATAASVALAPAGAGVEFYANDLAGSLNYRSEVEGRLPALDVDSNGYLDAEEYAPAMMQLMAPFEAVDTNGDEKIYADELVSFQEQKQAATRSQIVISAGGAEDPLFSALDSNHDERIDERELEGIDAQLTALDADGDGNVSVDEIPSRLSIGIVRGVLPRGGAEYTRPPTAITADAQEDAPRWFTRMDSNRDGTISGREFLGSAEQFAELDSDGDGFVDAGELPVPVESSEPPVETGEVTSDVSG